MEGQFIHIASFMFSHEYMGKELFNGFSIKKSQESAQLLKNLKVLIKPVNGGFNVLCSEPDLLEDTDPVLIQLVLKDPLFFNYTDLNQDFRPNSGIFFFSQSDKASSLGNFHSDEYVSVQDCIGILNQKNLEGISLANSSADYSVRDHTGNLVPVNKFMSYFLQSGETVFTVKGQEKEVSYYKGERQLDRLPFGIVALNLAELFLNYKTRGFANPFQIRFKARQTYWKYILSDKIFDRYSRLSVVDVNSNNEVIFKEGEFELQPEWKVRSFESTVEIPYRAVSRSRFQLIEKSTDSNQSGKVIHKHLPEARPEQLNQLQSKPGFSYSHIFI